MCVRNSRSSTSESLAERNAGRPGISTKGALEERMVRKNRVWADCTSHDYAGRGCGWTPLKSRSAENSAGRRGPPETRRTNSSAGFRLLGESAAV